MFEFPYSGCLKHCVFTSVSVPSREVPFFLSYFDETQISSTHVQKNIQILNLIKIRPVEAEMLYVDEKTDGATSRHVEANNRFPQFCERT